MRGGLPCPIAVIGKLGIMVAMEQLIETDKRGRASLGKASARYLMREEADGTLILEPATVVTELERQFMANSALQAQIEYAQAHPEQRRRRTPRNAR